MSNIEFYPIAIPFKRHHQELEGKVKEYDIVFRSDDSRIEDLIEFISLPFVKRVNIEFQGKVVPKVIQTASMIKDCLYVRLMPTQWNEAEKLKKEGICFFFDSLVPATSLCILDELISLGVSDVYLSDDLMYNLKEVSKTCHARGVQTRLILNHIPLTTFDKGKNPKSPMFRPQDVSYLEKFFDVFEFDCGKPYDWHVFNVMFKSYFIKRVWHGNLAELNHDINLEKGFPNDFILPEANLHKMNCQRVCDMRETNKCRKCEQMLEMGYTFLEKKARFV